MHAQEVYITSSCFVYTPKNTAPVHTILFNKQGWASDMGIIAYPNVHFTTWIFYYNSGYTLAYMTFMCFRLNVICQDAALAI